MKLIFCHLFISPFFQEERSLASVHLPKGTRYCVYCEWCCHPAAKLSIYGSTTVWIEDNEIKQRCTIKGSRVRWTQEKCVRNRKIQKQNEEKRSIICHICSDIGKCGPLPSCREQMISGLLCWENWETFQVPSSTNKNDDALRSRSISREPKGFHYNFMQIFHQLW